MPLVTPNGDVLIDDLSFEVKVLLSAFSSFPLIYISPVISINMFYVFSGSLWNQCVSLWAKRMWQKFIV